MSDAITTVIGLQNVPVSSTVPSDGYVLTYNNFSNEWEPGAPQKTGLNKTYFTDDGYWTAPDNVSTVLIIAAGGGAGGGGGGLGGFGGGGGGGSVQIHSSVNVVSNSVYVIKIGVGGLGGGGSIFIGGNGANGGNTLLKDAYDTTLFCALGAGLGLGAGIVDGGSFEVPGIGGANFASTPSPINRVENPLPMGYGGSCSDNHIVSNGQINIFGGFLGGNAGMTIGNFAGGGGGGAGPNGHGGDGGNSGDATPTNGSSVSANTGAGGGGGGGKNDSGSAASGGNGGSGYLYIIW